MHNYASALGIFGNLMTCTSAHGHLIFQLVEDEDSFNVAGDDGLYPEDEDGNPDAERAVESIGKLAWEKCFRSDEAGAICLKRPLVQEFNRVIPGYRVTPPTIFGILQAAYRYTDPRYRSRLDDGSDFDPREVVSREVLRFLRSLFRAYEAISENELRDCIYFITKIGDLLDFGPEGQFRAAGDRYDWPNTQWILQNWVFCRGRDPLEILAAQFLSNKVISVPERRVIGFQDVEGFSGEMWEGNSSRHLSFLERLGFVEKEPVDVAIQSTTGVEWYLHVTSRIPIVYNFTVIKDIPYHLLP